MFQALKQGTPIYVLEKGDTTKLTTGVVDCTSAPKSKYSNYPPYSQESTIDIKVRVGDNLMEFNHVPSNLAIANFGNVVISESKEAMLAEVENMLQTSRDVLASVEHHKKVLESCDEIVKQLNPAYAKEQERDATLSTLQGEVMSIKDSLAKILSAMGEKP